MDFDPKLSAKSPTTLLVEFLTALWLNPFHPITAKRQVQQRIQQFQARKRRQYIRLSLATAAAVLSGIIIQLNFKESLESKVPIGPGISQAVLTLANGKQIHLNASQPLQMQGLSSNGNQLTYETPKAWGKHSLSIPRGGQFSLLLSDGTQIWLNSDSKIYYPGSFSEDRSREVFLAYGEAYFEVASNSSPFRVVLDGQTVEVLGTEFNIKAYPEDSAIRTTLVEGRLEVNTPKESVQMSPQHQAIVSKKTAAILVDQVDSKKFVAWKEGLFYFDKTSLTDLTKTLSRWYNVDFDVQIPHPETYVYTGIIQRQENIEPLLKLILLSSTQNHPINFQIDRAERRIHLSLQSPESP